MANATKNVIIGSMAVSALVALLALVDIFTGYPFAGGAIGGAGIVMDVLFIIAAGLVIYMGWDSYRELR